MLDLRVIAQGASVPVFDLPAVLGRRQAAREIGDQIDALIAFIDDLAGDPDLEDGHDQEADDERELSYAEWDTRDAKTTSGGYEMRATGGTDDDEEDDEDCCTAGDDHVRSGNAPAYRAYYDNLGPGDPTDAEYDHCGCEYGKVDGSIPWGSEAVVDTVDADGEMIGRSVGGFAFDVEAGTFDSADTTGNVVHMFRRRGA